MKELKIFILLLIVWFPSNPIYSQTLALNEDRKEVEYVTQIHAYSYTTQTPLQNYYLKFYLDKSQNTDIHTITDKAFASKWQSFADLHPPLQANTTYWAKLNLHSNLDKDSYWILFLGYMTNAEIYAQQMDGTFEKSTAGFFAPNSQLIPNEGQSVKTRIFLPAKSKLQVFVKFKNNLPHPPEPEFALQAEKSWQTGMNQTDLIQGVFQGLLGMIFLYNLVLFISVGDKTYLHFALYALFVSLYFLNEYEYVEEYFLTNDAQISFHLNNLIYVALVFYIQFNRWFLNIPKDYPRWDNILRVWLGISTLFALISFPLAYFAFDYYLIARNAYHIFYSGALLLFIFMALWMSDVVAVFFILGNFCVLVGGIFIVMGNQGIIPFSLYYLLGGIATQMFVFMLALSYRFRKSMLEQQDTQVKLIAQLQENEQLQTKVNRELEGRVSERTNELAQKTEEIETQNEELQRKGSELEIAYQKITDSMRYAQRLQAAILGDEKQVMKDFPESFTILLPKDIVSGDFYWASKIKHTRILVAADCTGHGIPGALMTILGNSALNTIVNEGHIIQPDQILYELDKKVISTIEKQFTGIKKPQDGMDLIVISYDEKTRILKYAGAKNALYYVRDFEIHQIKASKYPIGIYEFEKNKVFDLHELKVQEDDIFYLTSDGFPDQWGKEETKYLTKRFREFLLKISHLPMDVQRVKVLEEFMNWKGDKTQTDDVLVIGLKF
jgi:two-component system, sensor histidine kinase LadS